ncbi:unnamed protein product [Hydatigera taeniaeformis]|uniref:Uncharacterized protein n=1 Tax=Hydatigena taeniaeformis TaxID=6205 RepID=A0A3P7FJU7_HYDTA|nr:unnamed protein product [Hydatigera taeniaeformis]
MPSRAPLPSTSTRLRDLRMAMKEARYARQHCGLLYSLECLKSVLLAEHVAGAKEAAETPDGSECNVEFFCDVDVGRWVVILMHLGNVCHYSALMDSELVEIRLDCRLETLHSVLVDKVGINSLLSFPLFTHPTAATIALYSSIGETCFEMNRMLKDVHPSHAMEDNFSLNLDDPHSRSLLNEIERIISVGAPEEEEVVEARPMERHG